MCTPDTNGSKHILLLNIFFFMFLLTNEVLGTSLALDTSLMQGWTDNYGFLGLLLTSVLPIVRTCRTASVCASDYDDRTQFYMFEQKNEHG